MKDIRAALRSILLADSAIAASVSSGNSPDLYRIYPAVLPQGITAPSIVENLISEVMGYFMQGDDGLMQARIQLDAWALTPDLAVSLGGKVYDCLSGFSGFVSYGSNSPQDTMTIRGVFHDQGRDDYDSVAKLYVRRRDYLIWYTVR